MNIYQISKVYDNSNSAYVERHTVRDSLVGSFLKATSIIFRTIDRQDDQQILLSRKVWILRATILYTLSDFASPELSLANMAEMVRKDAEGYPDLRAATNSVVGCTIALVERQENTKRASILEKIKSLRGEAHLMTRMTLGSGIGWADKKPKEFLGLDFAIPTINSIGDLSVPVSHIIVPGGIGNAPAALTRKLFFGGMTNSVSVFCYEGERFSLPSRPEMRNQNILSSLRDITIQEQSSENGDYENIEDFESWMTEKFWAGVHGGDREHRLGKEAARYVLFSNGRGCCLSEDGSVLIIRNLVTDITERDFNTVCVPRLNPGDWVLLRVGSAGTRLDETSDRLIEESGEEGLLEKATDWKSALDALTLTKSFQEISDGMREFGCKVSAHTILNWLNDEVLGPVNIEALRALIRYLVSERKITIPESDLDDYVLSRWRLLQEFRGLRHRAGNIIRRELIDRLIDLIKKSAANESDPDEFSISSDESSAMMLVRIEMIDNKTCYVSPSRFGQLDDHRSRRWLA